MTAQNPVVAIVGRPNVGKSALFNRIVRRRVAIVHEESGVTRDRVSAEARVDQRRIELIDTGGLGSLDHASPTDVFDKGIQLQIDAAIEDAAAIIFVVDITAGRLPLDQQVADNLHASGRPVFIAANKSDNPSLEPGEVEFEPLGFPVFPVSALHNRGISELLGEISEVLPSPEVVDSPEPLRVAVVGKPNVGKSSYVNRLLHSDRVIVSEIPGTTRDSIEVPFVVGSGPQARHYRLIDTAGMRRKRKAKGAVEKFSIMRAEKSIERADVVIHVLTADGKSSSQDKRIASLITEHEKGAVLLINKWDLADETQRHFLPEIARELPFLSHLPVVFVSSLTGYNIRKSVEAIDHVAAQINTNLGTGVLNRVLQDAFTSTPPPVAKGKRIKLFYATQIGTKPIRVKLFVNYPRSIPSNYRAFLIKSLRKAFGLEGAAVTLHFAMRTRND